jgi:hypothetical protein
VERKRREDEAAAKAARDPKCQGAAAKEWLAEREAELLEHSTRTV